MSDKQSGSLYCSPYFSTNQEPSFDFDLSCANQGVQIQDGSAAYSHTKATSDSGLSPKKKKKKKVTKEERKIYEERRLKTPDKKFGGLTEEDVKKLLLPDHLAENLDILFIGINPGLVSAYKGHHYCGNNNHFYFNARAQISLAEIDGPLLYDSGLIEERLTYEEDYKCLQYGIGMTNIVARTTRSAAELTRSEIKAGREAALEMIRKLKPLVVCFNGKGIYEIFANKKKCSVGRQEDIGDTAVYVMPSTSGLVAQYPRKEDKLVFFQQLKQLRDERKKEKEILSIGTSKS